MATYKAKTTENNNSVEAFIAGVDAARQADCQALVSLMEDASGQPAKMWGPAIIGCGSYHYRYESGHEGDMPQVAFSPRKAALVLYLGAFPEREALLQQLGKHKTGKGCIYVNKLADIDVTVLRKMMAAVVQRYA